jgi:hypothetical protein
MAGLGLNRSKVQQQAPVDNKTLQSVIEGARRPSLDVQSKIEKVLGWPPGEMSRRARGESSAFRPLDAFRDTELLSELLQRAIRREGEPGGDTSPTKFAPSNVRPLRGAKGPQPHKQAATRTKKNPPDRPTR